MNQYSVRKRNELSRHKKYKACLLSERSLSEKTIYCMIQLPDYWKRQIMKNVKGSVVARDLEGKRED
jgi:hypothetical protein